MGVNLLVAIVRTRVASLCPRVQECPSAFFVTRLVLQYPVQFQESNLSRGAGARSSHKEYGSAHTAEAAIRRRLKLAPSADISANIRTKVCVS